MRISLVMRISLGMRISLRLSNREAQALDGGSSNRRRLGRSGPL